MREALRDLEAQGLISNVPHKGPAVAMLTRNDAREIYEVRSALEPLAAKLFVERATDEQISELHAMADRCRHAMAKRNVLALIDALEGFYKTLFAGAGNQMAAMLARMIYNKAGLLRAVTFQRQTDIDAKRSMDHIVRIAAAIRSRDADPPRQLASCRSNARAKSQCDCSISSSMRIAPFPKCEPGWFRDACFCAG
jgi:DNA-binding GntR family transcriptional regulator